jgi:hypothetical protein
MRLYKKILLIAVLLLAAAAGVIAWKIGPRNIIGMLRYDQRKEGSLKVGDRAPDVSLVSLDGTTPVRLSERVGIKPLILVFGSYT